MKGDKLNAFRFLQHARDYFSRKIALFKTDENDFGGMRPQSPNQLILIRIVDQNPAHGHFIRERAHGLL